MGIRGILWIISAFGGIAFIIKMVLLLVGSDDGGLDHGDADAGADIHLDGHVDAAGHGADGHDSTGSFLTISIQTILAFIMMFGLFGLAALNFTSSNLIIFTAAGIGGLAGGAASAFMMKALKKLNSIPKKPDPQVGDTGIAYIPVSETGGEVILKFGGRQENFEAVTENGEKIPAFESIIVTGKINNTLTVTRFNQEIESKT